MSDMDVPLCKDCRWVSRDAHGWSFARCDSPRAKTRSLVDGSLVGDGGYCSIARGRYGPHTDCGPKGDWFEPKPPRVGLWERLRRAVSHPDPGAMRSERSERATSNPNLRTP